MQITERQKSILEKIIEEYIDSAFPVSSQLLSEKCDFNICPASLRIEMEKLSKQGFLDQPFVSSGRVPTDKAYRFFVDLALEKTEKQKATEKALLEEMKRIEEEITDSFKRFHSLTKTISEITSNLTISYLPKKRFFFKEGWNEIAKEPEFVDVKKLSSFTELIESWENKVIGSPNFPENIQVWIGGENPYTESKDFSAIISSCFFPKEEKGIIAIFGPKRMTYDKNIGILNLLNKKNAARKKAKSA